MNRQRRALLTAPAIATSNYPNEVLATNPIRYWQLNEAAGTVAADSSGNAENATYTGTFTYQADTTPQGIPAPLFTPIARITGNRSGNDYNMGEFSMLMWVKPSAASVWTDGISREFFFLQDISRLDFIFNKTTNNNEILVSYNGLTLTYTDGGANFNGGWVSLLVSVSKLADTIELYVNGVLVASANTLPAAIAAPTRREQFCDNWTGYAGQLIVWAQPADANIIALAT